MKFYISRANWEWENEEEKIIKEYPQLNNYRVQV